MHKIHSKRFRVGVLIATGLAVFTVFFVFCHQVNQKYPQPVTETYALHKPLVYCDLQYTVTDFDIVNWQEMAEKFPNVEFTLDPVGNGEIQSAEDMYVLLWSMEITNLSANEKKCYIYDFVGITTTWHNGLDLNLFYDLNDSADMQVSLSPFLQPNETISVMVPIPITKGQVPADEWDTIEDMDFGLLFALYPKKIVFLPDSYYNGVKFADVT